MEDLRVRRTKRLIVGAFYRLLQKEDFNKITIQEIADEAMINRQTFYIHYQDKYDLLQKIIEGFSQKAVTILAEQVNGLKQPIIKTLQDHYDELVGDKDKINLLLSQNYCHTLLSQNMRRDFLAFLKKQTRLQLTDFQAKVIATDFMELIMIVYSSKKIPSQAEIRDLYKIMNMIIDGHNEC